MQQGWRSFLVKVANEAGVTATPVFQSPNAAPLFHPSGGSPEPPRTVPESEVPHRFLDLMEYSSPPLKPTLSGLALEYRILQLYSRDVGKRDATLSCHVGQGTQDLGFRNEVSILFDCIPAVPVTLEVREEDGRPSIASFVIRDAWDRIYPLPSRRLAPDFFFHSQIYRAHGETVPLAARRLRGGVRSRTGVPPVHAHVESECGPGQTATFSLKRWIHVAAEGWWSGDHHVHAAGCAHYESPSQG